MGMLHSMIPGDATDTRGARCAPAARGTRAGHHACHTRWLNGALSVAGGNGRGDLRIHFRRPRSPPACLGVGSEEARRRRRPPTAPPVRTATDRLVDCIIWGESRGNPNATYESGLKERLVVSEFPSLEKAIAGHDSPGYQEALRALGDGAVRDIRIIEGLE